ncbi:methyltransferase [Scheffersomyces amazonensis]|uniref:methyltransferase n=1 Tax=Scheffersomyces amazonensis TaxID=1078765 RepID=UPI00315CD267
MSKEQAYYSKGYKKEIADTHAWRTVANSSAFVIPILKPDFKILDVGSGPGTITIDFANYVPEGSVIGVEPTAELIERANEEKAKKEEETGVKLENVTFQDGSIYSLPFEDNTFDVVHAHQVVIHLQDPVAALKELRRVVKVGGYVCVKDADLDSIIAYPDEYSLIIRDYLVKKASNAVSTDIKAGRSLREKAIKAGFEPEHTLSSSSTWCTTKRSEKIIHGERTLKRLQNSGEEIVKNDPEANQREIEKLVDLWHRFVEDDAAWGNILHGEIIYTKQ